MPYKDPVKAREYSLEHYKKNRDKYLQNARTNYWENREEHLAYAKEYAEKNPDKSSVSRRNQWLGREKEHADAVRRWRKRNPEKFKANKVRYKMNRLAREKNAPGVFDYQSWIKKVEYLGWKCFYCKIDLTLATMTVDHRKPLVRGGSNWTANLAPACMGCNMKKRARTCREFFSVINSEGE